MSYELLIAEKPNAALRIATALADKKLTKKLNKKIPYYELKHDGKDIVIASAVGHLYGLKEKIKNGWNYPTFSYEWRPIYEIEKKSAYTKDYIETIKKLSKDASSFTVSTDYDDEGTVLGLNVIRFACNQDDANRMKFSTLTKNDLVDAYKNKLKHLDWGQANAGLTRHVLDWEFGINLSRALTLAIKNTKGGFKILSTGRVQGPALKIIVERHKEIINFKPEPFWLIQLIGKVNSKSIEAWHKKDKFWNKKEAEEVIERTKSKTAIISDLKTTKYNQLPPPPFDLTSLQIEAYRTLKINPQETLSIAQNLYLAGLISYPRTSSQQIPSSINLKEILEKLSKQIEYKALCKSLLSLKDLTPNNGKKTDPAHPACIPTGEQPKSLKEQEKKLYDLIVRRTLATLSSPAIRETSEIEIDCNKELFIMKGTRTVEPGWHKFYHPYINYSEEEIPKGEIGQKIEQLQIQIHAKETQPPKRYTPASIIKELEKRSLGTKSISGDTLIYLNGYWSSIRQLFNSGEKTEENLLVKLPAVTFYSLNKKRIDVKTKVLVAKRVKGKNERMFSIETPFTKIISDSSHKYFLVDSDILYEKPAKSLGIGECLLFTKLNHFGQELIALDWLNSINRRYPLKIKNKCISYQTGIGFRLDALPVLESSKLFWLLGYIYGDGHVYKQKKYDGYNIGITIDKNQRFLINKIIKTITDLFGEGRYGITVPSKKNVIRIDIPSVISYYLTKKFSSLISKSIFDVPQEYKGDFIKGYMDADGNIYLRGKNRALFNGVSLRSNNTARIKLTLSREDHILWIKQMLNSLGIKTTTPKSKIAKIKQNEYKCYEIKISGKNNILLYAINVGFEHPKKRDMLYEGLLNNSIQYEPIKKIIKCFSELLKYNNEFIKFEDKLTYIFKNYEKLNLVERKRRCVGYSRKYDVRIPTKLVTKIINFLLPIYGEEFSPWNYAVKITRSQIIECEEDDLYDLIVDKENPTFITFGGQVMHNSTRSQIIDTLYQRHYIQNQSIEATNLGISTIETLEKYSHDIIDEKLTRHFEKEMQEIQSNKKTKEKVIEESEKVLVKILKHFKENEQKIGQELIKALYETRENASLLGKCPKCNLGELKIKKGKYGSFISCSRYEEGCDTTFSLPSNSLVRPTEKSCEICSYPLILSIRKGKKPQELCFNSQCPTKKIDESKIKNKKCPKCKAGNLVLRKSIYGAFLACDKYPKCYYKESLQKSYKQSIPEKMQVDT